MIVYYVHDHIDIIVMQRFNHLLHFFYSDASVIRIGCVRAFRHVIVLRVISPVVLRRI